jgi:hypothetical protein
LLGVCLSIVPFALGGLFAGNHATDSYRQIDLPWVNHWDCTHTTDCTSTPIYNPHRLHRGN